MNDREVLIRTFFDLGMSQVHILKALANHGYIISQRHLRRLLCSMSLSRRGNYSDIAEIIRFIHNELKQSGKLHGYRWMLQKCLSSGLRVLSMY